MALWGYDPTVLGILKAVSIQRLRRCRPRPSAGAGKCQGHPKSEPQGPAQTKSKKCTTASDYGTLSIHFTTEDEESLQYQALKEILEPYWLTTSCAYPESG